MYKAKPVTSTNKEPYIDLYREYNKLCAEVSDYLRQKILEHFFDFETWTTEQIEYVTGLDVISDGCLTTIPDAAAEWNIDLDEAEKYVTRADNGEIINEDWKNFLINNGRITAEDFTREYLDDILKTSYTTEGLIECAKALGYQPQITPYKIALFKSDNIDNIKSFADRGVIQDTYKPALVCICCKDETELLNVYDILLKKYEFRDYTYAINGLGRSSEGKLTAENFDRLLKEFPFIRKPDVTIAHYLDFASFIDEKDRSLFDDTKEVLVTRTYSAANANELVADKLKELAEAESLVVPIDPDVIKNDFEFWNKCSASFCTLQEPSRKELIESIVSFFFNKYGAVQPTAEPKDFEKLYQLPIACTDGCSLEEYEEIYNDEGVITDKNAYDKDYMEYFLEDYSYVSLVEACARFRPSDEYTRTAETVINKACENKEAKFFPHIYSFLYDKQYYSVNAYVQMPGQNDFTLEIRNASGKVLGRVEDIHGITSMAEALCAIKEGSCDITTEKGIKSASIVFDKNVKEMKNKSEIEK